MSIPHPHTASCPQEEASELCYCCGTAAVLAAAVHFQRSKRGMQRETDPKTHACKADANRKCAEERGVNLRRAPRFSTYSQEPRGSLSPTQGREKMSWIFSHAGPFSAP